MANVTPDQTFQVSLHAHADVYCSCSVQATSIAEAQQKAIAKANDGNVEWTYDGVISETIEATTA